jgi:hypothetical protein
MIDFLIKQYSDLPVLTVNIDKDTSDILISENFNSYILTFTMTDSNGCIVLRDTNNTSFLLSENDSNKDSCEETYIKAVSYHFNRINTSKTGQFKGVFSIYIDLDENYKEIILTDHFTIEIVPSIHS